MYVPSSCSWETRQGLEWPLRKKNKSHDGGWCLPLGTEVESVCSWRQVLLVSKQSPFLISQMPLPALKPTEVWAEEDAIDILPSAHERIWDNASVITRERWNVQEDKGQGCWMGTQSLGGRMVHETSRRTQTERKHH